MNRLTAAAVSVGLAVTGVAAVPAQGAQQTTAARAATTGYSPLQWGTCGDEFLDSVGAECADLVVPLDYDRPRGRKISLAVSRVAHRSPDSAYQGVMLVNPGGPGGSGLVFSVLGIGDFVPGDADDTYDWIGFDPRGVGSSSPTLACDGQYFGYDRPNYVPTSRAVLQAWLRRSEGYARDCARAAGRQLLPHVRTTDTVADMESLRKALGQRRINYYGFSYGTYLGQVYATLHPNRVRRFVFDANVDPRRVWYRANQDQDVAFEKVFRIYAGYVAAHDDVFHLGTTARAVRAGYFAELDKLDAAPAGGVIGPDELADVMLNVGYNVSTWVEVGLAYAALVNDGDFSAIKAMYDAANPQTDGSDNGFAMYLGTVCTDARWPDSLRRVIRDNTRLHRRAPFVTWGNAWFNGPCSFWPAASGRPVRVDGGRVRGKILLLGETLDAATPFSGSLEVRRRFPTASLVEGVGGTTHAASLSGIACTDNTVARYLDTGAVPRRKAGTRSDRRCPPLPQPEAVPAAQLQRSAGSMQQVVRDALQAAATR